MRKYERDFLNQIRGNSNSFDFRYRNNADVASPVMNNAVPAGIKGNPPFVATFNLTFLAKYFTLNGGTYTEIAAADLNAALKSDLPFFVFGENDYASGFKNLKAQFPINSNWVYGTPGIYGKEEFTSLAFDANVEGQLQTGDLIVPITSALPGTGTTTLALMIVRCPEVGYGSLLSMISSDRFQINGIRYVLSDTDQLAQYTRQIQFQALSIFGKYQNDKLTPNDYKVPEQFQNGIIDIPIAGKWGAIDKHKAWGFYNKFDNVESSWTLFCPNVDKLSA